MLISKMFSAKPKLPNCSHTLHPGTALLSYWLVLGGMHTHSNFLRPKLWKNIFPIHWHRAIYAHCWFHITIDLPATTVFFFMKKKDGKLQLYINYWGLNKVTVKYCYSLPLVPAAIEQVRGAKLFSKFDLRSAYNLIHIWEGDEWKTAFVANTEHCEYLIIPYGLIKAPSVFQAFTCHHLYRQYPDLLLDRSWTHYPGMCSS